MKIHNVHLNDITFDPREETLAFPFYANLINPLLVTEQQRQCLQLEPAFQFLAEGDPDTYDFHFRLRRGAGIYFVRGADGRPMMQEANSTRTEVPGISAELTAAADDFGHLERCTLRVKPFEMAKDQRVVSLRIFCNRDPRSGKFEKRDGVSLSLILPGVDLPANPGSGLPKPNLGVELKVEVAGVKQGEQWVPSYSIYQDFPLPPSLGLELALRMSAARPVGTLHLALRDEKRRFLCVAGGDDDIGVNLKGNTRERPAELSSVKTYDDGKAAQFTWRSGLDRESWQPRLVSFSFQVESLVAGSHQISKAFDVDPVLFNDPPPIGPAYP